MPPRSTFGKLQITMLRRGELRGDTVYDAAEGARLATKYAKQGWRVEVQKWGKGPKPAVPMRCEPATSKGKVIARCTLTPAFKKAIRPKRPKRR